MSSAPSFFKVSFFSTDWVFGITIFNFKSYSLHTTAKPIPVLPAVPSTIIPSFFNLLALIASLIIPKAARSLTEPPGFKNSAFPRISQPVNSDK